MKTDAPAFVPALLTMTARRCVIFAALLWSRDGGVEALLPDFSVSRGVCPFPIIVCVASNGPRAVGRRRAEVFVLATFVCACCATADSDFLVAHLCTFVFVKCSIFRVYEGLYCSVGKRAGSWGGRQRERDGERESNSSISKFITAARTSYCIDRLRCESR